MIRVKDWLFLFVIEGSFWTWWGFVISRNRGSGCGWGLIKSREFRFQERYSGCPLYTREEMKRDVYKVNRDRR